MFTAGDVETVTVIDPGGRDRFGDRTGGDPPWLLHGCLFAPGSSLEDNENANQVTTDATLYCPPGSQIGEGHQVRVRGDTYEVNGKPQNWPGFGVVAALTRTSG